ncbi:MAG: phospholipase D-like domain-containing protein [Saprospiraceae bacterium]|nr:phospholipase D-like domain-containing protein [Saprospiraceae bacterium]MDW8485170.1 phospholipase D-like domain-containing protein [Saprospiraceae bacterium]
MKAYVRAEQVEFIPSGEPYFRRLITLIAEAQKTFHLQVYIFADDRTGTEVAEALRAAARRGVQVRVIVDGFGSSALPNAFVERMQADGVHFRFFKHWLSLKRWQGGRTLHQKVAVADARRALIGGINIADRYRGTPEEPAWLDLAVYIEGEVCRYLNDLCDDIFYHHYWKRRWPQRKDWTAWIAAVGKTAWLPPPPREGLVRFRLNDWLRRKSEVFYSYLHAIRDAKHSLTLIASYFLPGPAIRQRLERAVKRGVLVRLLLSGPSDVPLMKWAERYVAYDLIRKGVHVFLWQHSVMHGKAILVDGQWASVGSFNLNPLSRFRSLEMNVDVADPTFVRTLCDYIETLFEQYCVQITAERLPEFANFWTRLKAQLAYFVAVLLMRVLFASSRQLQ